MELTAQAVSLLLSRKPTLGGRKRVSIRRGRADSFDKLTASGRMFVWMLVVGDGLMNHDIEVRRQHSCHYLQV